MDEICWPCLWKFKVKRDKESDRTGLSDGNTPHAVSALSSTYPTAPGQLILVEGGIPGQEGLRILPAAPVLGPESGAGVSDGGMAGEDCLCVCVRVWVSVYAPHVCKRLQLHDSARLFRGLRCRRASCLVNWLLFWGSCRRHRCLPGRDEDFRNLFNSQAGEGAKGHRGILGMLLPSVCD